MTDTPLRWLLMASHVPPGGALGGMVRYTVELARALVARPDIELSVLCAAEAVDYWAAEVGDVRRAYPLARVPVPAQGWLERQGRGSEAFRQNFDVIQGTKHLLPRRTTATTVLTVHDLLPLDRPGDFGRLKRALLPGPYLASAAEADVLVCISAATRDRLLSYVPQVADRTSVIPLANESAGLGAAEPRAIAELRNTPFALVVGDSSPRKNLPLVVNAWPEVRRRIPDARLAVVGPPSWGESHLGSGHLDPGVQILGRIDDDQLRWAYAHAHVVLCPSLLEGFGLPSVEGLRAGTPVITSEDPALCEASGAAARHVSSLEPRHWVDAIVDALAERGTVTRPVTRTWQQVADETVRAVRHVAG